MSNSDDFSSGTLAANWRLEGPSQGTVGFGSDSDDAYLTLATPDGTFDAWQTNGTARIMQDAADEDFQLETRFLSTPQGSYQMQGFLIEQDAQNWMRFDTYSSGNTLYAYIGRTVNGQTSKMVEVAIPGGTAPYLRVTRTGDDWLYQYSLDGTAWTTVGTVTHDLTVDAVGLFSGNLGQSNGFEAQVDYFEVASDPILDEDGGHVHENQAPVVADDTFTTEAGTALDVSAAQLLANDSDPDGDALTVVSVGTPSNGVLMDNGDGTWTYAPDAGFQGTDSFTYTVTDGAISDTGTVTVTVRPPSVFDGFSDDFSGASLDEGWTFKGITGSATLSTTETDAIILLESPAGIPVSASDVMTTPRLMQDVADGDFQISAGFLNEPQQMYQEHGLLIVQDDANWIRFDLAYTHMGLTLIVGQIVDGSTTYPLFDGSITAGQISDFRITRTGDTFVFETSSDGVNWQQAFTLTRDMTVSEVGAFAGTAPYQNNPPPGYTAQLDYFETSADPIIDEDGSFDSNRAPVAGDDAFQVDPDTAVSLSQDDLLGNDSDPNGDTLTITGVTQPANGTLTDNGDGTWTYTPNAGFSGTDTFTYTVSDGSETDTATVTLTVTEPTANPLASDDFASGTLGANWRLEGPSQGTVGFGSDANDAYLTLATPDGTFDAWQTNGTARIMQDAADEDFQIETRFLSTPQGSYQIQGILIEQDAQNWMRFDTYSSGNTLYAYIGRTVNGQTSKMIEVAIPGGTAPYLRVTRTGDSWTFEYSTNGTTWTTAGTVTHAMTVDAAGLFSGNLGQSNGFESRVDYFEVSHDPILDEDGTPVEPPANQAPVAVDDTLATETDTALSFTANQLLSNDSDPDGDAVTITGVTQPANGTLTDNGDGTWTYTPNAGFSGTDTFTYTVTDGAETDTATVTLTVTEPTANPLASDDFASGTLGANWRLEGPSQGTVGFGSDANDAYLTLATPDGTFDAWQTNGTARIMQDAADEDFQIETRFLSTPQGSYQIQGILIEQDAQNWMRFDTYSSGNTLYAYIGRTVNGQTSKMIEVAIPGGTAPYLRVTRTGDSWTFEYSTNGTTWTTAGTVTHAMTVDAAGLFSGNLGQSNGFEARVDYFEVSHDPIVDEDGTPVEPPANQAPVAVDDSFSTGSDTALDFSEDQLLSNDSDPDGDALTVTDVSQPANGTVTDNENGDWTYTPNPGFSGSDSFEYTVSDGVDSENATVTVIVTDPAENPMTSDDFASGALGSTWRYEGPAQGTVGFGSNATDAYLTLATPDGTFDAWQTNGTARIMQDAVDEDFQIETRFLSTPQGSYQMQGILVEQDAQNWMRFDTYSAGNTLYAYIGRTVNGQTSRLLEVAIPGGTAPYVRVTRDGDNWTFEYSTDGNTWTSAGTVTHALTVDSVGLFSGNLGQSNGFEARVDYFEVSNDPLTDEDGNFVPQNQGPTAVADSFSTADGTPVTFSAADLLANDSDPENDTLTVASIGQPSNGSLVDNGNGTWTYTPFSGFGGLDTFTYTVTDGDKSSVGNVSVTVGDPIDVWYGDTQTFGAQGETQVWINILGNVSGEVASMSYSLNGGPAQYLSVGADTRRLQDAGDFNVEIAYSDLDGSATDDVVTITAVMTNGQTYTQDVIVDYEDGSVWDANYSIDWSSVSDITDVVQVVDGTWTIGQDGVRPVDLGYDRLLTLGDESWDNYQVSMQITPHDLTNVDPRGRDGGGFALGMLWNGHTDTPIANAQPHVGWEPGAAFFFHDENGDGNGTIKLHPSLNFFNTLGTTAITINQGTTYNVEMQVEMVGLYDRLYSLKIWEDGTAEPQNWTLQGVQTFSIDQAPSTGSLYLNAHYNDVSFGDLTVTEIEGRDIIQGTDGDDVQVAVINGSTDPGMGEIDVFVGGGGADTFVFGDQYGTYYDDNNASSAGTEDYGFVWDFTSGTDKVQLWGSASDYVLTQNTAGLPAGTAIWLSIDGEEDELIGVLNQSYNLSLASDDFVFTDPGLFA